ncbi:hypothetical protein TIFTF001_007845 [Ficus carica]|uniref:non-specific serine/threonine protein kinase n=1 Tax=Ficus carica TaxID=3494 RepID=A0AA87ZRZ1_FICCA|nr:hypothetical protein TIFTF001_007845 [Ficus carica]
MENPFSYLHSILLLTFFCLYSDTFVGAVEQRFQNCSVSRSCGNQPITFPFYIEEEHNYCGYPGFHLSCSNINNGDPRPTLKLFGDDYIVHNIFYQNQSLIVSNTAFSLPNDTSCFPPLRKLSLTTDFFLTPNQSQVFLLQNCHNFSSDLLKYRIGCSAENDTNSVLALPGNDMNRVAKASEKCGVGSSAVDLAVMKLSGENDHGMKEVLSRGFMLSWVADDCAFCNSTGGKCGFDYPTNQFKCYCPDRPHRRHCDPPAGQSLILFFKKSSPNDHFLC